MNGKEGGTVLYPLALPLAMAEREHFDVFDRSGEIVDAIRHCVFLTTRRGDKVNTMAIEWGALGNLWAKPVFIAFVRRSRFTREMLDANPEFTINIPTGPYDKKIFKICGGRSGRDVDKVKETGMTLVDGEKVSVPGILELPMTLECKVVYRREQDVSLIPEDVRKRFYPHMPERDHDTDEDDHVVYIGEVVDAYVLRRRLGF